MDDHEVSAWTLLFQSPFKLYNREDDSENFLSVVKNTVAPYYKVQSITSILIFIPIIVYVTLVVAYPPFLHIPTFAAEPLQLHPEDLKHFQFYRLFTSPLLFEDLSSLVVGCLVMWSFGSYTEEFLGYRMLIVFCGFYGLIGSCYYLCIPCFLVGCNFANALIAWPDPTLLNMHKKMLLVIYIIIGLIYFFIFFNLPPEQKFSSYISTFEGILLTFILGLEKDPDQVQTFRKLLQFLSLLIFISINSSLIINIIFARSTFL